MISETTSRKIDYWTEIETAAKNGTGAPEHDCPDDNPEPQGCQVCADYYESRKWWLEQLTNKFLEQLANKFNEKLL